ncbi:MAG: hypothetical protein Q8K70_05435 [Bacteroidota bacterium]|nr:hypothetical protein [Bacteroidota bacterium]
MKKPAEWQVFFGGLVGMGLICGIKTEKIRGYLNLKKSSSYIMKMDAFGSFLDKKRSYKVSW